MSKMTFLDLFSGIGGFSIGLEAAGMTCAGHVEVEPYCREILKAHWPDVPLWGDVKQLRGEDVGYVDLVCGGPPCQPASLAGKRKGAADDRWLWPEALRLVAEIRPAWCLFENPAGLRTMGLDGVLAELEGQGYACQTLDIPACAVDAPHRRHRLWILAHAEDLRRPALQRRPADGILRPLPGGPLADAQGEPSRPAGQSRQDGDVGDWSGARWLLCADRKWRRVEPGIQLLAHGVPRRIPKLKAFGNAVAPRVVYEIGRAIWEAHHG